jgi:hypothetical protein
MVDEIDYFVSMHLNFFVEEFCSTYICWVVMCNADQHSIAMPTHFQGATFAKIAATILNPCTWVCSQELILVRSKVLILVYIPQ